MFSNKRKKIDKKKINIVIAICFLLTSGAFIAEGSWVGGVITLLAGGTFLGAYKLFEKFATGK